MSSATTSAPESNVPPSSCEREAQAAGRAGAGPVGDVAAERRLGQLGEAAERRVDARRPRRAATPFCGPKIAVAPSAPVSGLLTSDMMRISHAGDARVERRRRRRAQATARPSGVGGDRAARVVEELERRAPRAARCRRRWCCCRRGPIMKRRTPRVEQARDELAEAARRACADRRRACRPDR